MQDTQQLQSAITNYPLPLAQALRRAVNAKSPQEQHNGAYYFFESALKLSASAQLGVYFSLGCPHGPLNQLIENLTRPSVGHWLALLRECSAYLASRQDNGLLPLQGVNERLTRKQPMPAVKAFLEFAARTSDKQEGRQSFKVLDFFDAVVSYRNQELGHGAMRERAFYAEASPLLLEAALEAINALRPVGDLQFVVARDVVDPRTQKASRRFDVLRGDGLHLPLETNQPRDAEIPAGRLLLAAGAVRVQLHPLLVYEIDKLDRDRVGFLNHVAAQGRGDTAKLKRVEYLDYDSGDRLEGHDALSELAALLSKLRGQPVNAEAVALLSQGGAEAAPAQAAPGSQSQFIGDFELIEELGRGGMGIVYKARQNSLRRVVALKVLPPGLSGDPVSVARFKREIAALGRCDHPNVVKVLTAGQDGERHFYAMEYVEGSDLAQVCGVLSHWKTGSLKEGHILKAITDSRAHRSSEPGKGSGTFSHREKEPDPIVPKAAEIVPEISEGRDYFTRLAEILGDAALGVQHLHEHGIIHRDLKPANVMLTGDGKRAVIMDLGLAQLQDRSLSLTASSVKILGTLRYMPPEQLQHQMLEVTPKADVYSLGATIYELAALAPMFDGDTEARLMQQVLQEEPKPARSHNAAIPRDLETIITVATAKTPADRYATAGALAADLRAFARGEPISARAPTTFHYLKLFYRKNTRLVQGMAAALVVLLALTAWFIVSLDESRVQAERSAEIAREKEAQATHEAERANKAEQDAKEKAAAAQKARDEANTQKGVAEAKTREVEAALKEAARNLQQIHMEKGKASSDRGEFAASLSHFAQAARIAQELGDAARFEAASREFCATEPRLPFLLWRTRPSPLLSTNGEISATSDGRIFACGGTGKVLLIEAATGLELRSIPAAGGVKSALLSGDGTRLLLCTWEKAELWDAIECRLVAKLDPIASVHAGAFSADNKRLQVVFGKGQCAEIDAANGAVLSERPLQREISSAAFSPDAAHFVVWAKGKRLEVFETLTLKSLGAVDTGANYYRSIALTAGGKQMLLGTDTGKFVVWETSSLARLCELDLMLAYGKSITASADGRVALLPQQGGVLVFGSDWHNPQKIATPGRLNRSVVFMPGNTAILVGRNSGAPLFLRLSDGANLAQLPSLNARPFWVEWSPDRRKIACATYELNLLIFDAASGSLLRKLDKTEIQARVFKWLPDGRRLACFSPDGARVMVLDAESGAVLREAPPLPKGEGVVDIAVSPDARHVFICTNRARIMRLEVEGSEQPRFFSLPGVGEMQYSPVGLRVSADGSTLVVSDESGVVLWLAADDGALLRRFMPTNPNSRYVALDNTGGRIALLTGQHDLKVHGLADGRVFSVAIKDVDQCTGAWFGADGEFVTLDLDRRVRVYELKSGLARTLLTLPDSAPVMALFDDAGRSLVTVSDGGVLSLYALESARALRPPPIAQKEVFDLFWVPGTTLLAVGAMKSPVFLVDMATGRISSEIGEAAEIRAGFVLNPDGRTLLCGGMGKSIDAHDLFTGQTRPFCSIPPEHLNFGGGYSPDGKLVALTFFTEKPDEKAAFIRIVDAASGEKIRDLAEGPGMLMFSRFLKNGKHIVVSGFKRKSAVFDASSGALIREIGEELDQTLAFDLDAESGIFVAPGANHALKLYDVDTGSELGELAGHTDTVTRAFFSPDRKRMVTLSADQTVRVWDLATRKEIAQRPVGRTNDVIGLTFSGDGREVMCVGENGQIIAWDYEGKSTLSSALKLDAGVMVALAQSRSDSRLNGFDLETIDQRAALFEWATQNGVPVVAPVGAEGPRGRDVLPEAGQRWLADARAWLCSWIVDHAAQSWRRPRAAWRYTEHMAPNGKTVRQAVPLGADWVEGQELDYAAWWVSDRLGEHAAAYKLLEESEAKLRWAEAGEAARRLAIVNPADRWLHFRCGRAGLRAGDWGLARQAFDEYLKTDPENLTALAYSAIAESHDGDLNSAEFVERLEKAIKAGIRSVDVWVALARFNRNQDEGENAADNCLKALKLEPANLEAITLLAEIYAELGRLEESELWLTKALELTSETPVLWSMRAEIREKRANYTGAIEDFTNCIDYYIKHRDLLYDASLMFAYRGRAQMHLKLGKKEKALEDYTSAIAELPNDYDARVARGSLYLEAERWLEALNDFSEAASYNGWNHKEPYFGQGRAALELNDPALAVDAFEMYFKTNIEGGNPLAPFYAACASALLSGAYETGTLAFPTRSDETRGKLEKQFKELNQQQRNRLAAEYLSGAIEYLRALAVGGFKDVGVLEHEPRLERARKDPRWAEIIKAVKANK